MVVSGGGQQRRRRTRFNPNPYEDFEYPFRDGRSNAFWE
jgi:hypothetical protein